MGGHGAINPSCCGSPCKHFQEGEVHERIPAVQIAVQEFKLVVPTYNATYFADEVENGTKEEFGDPTVPVLIHEAEGVRVVLGTHDFNDLEKPDIQIERQPNGWMIFLHPLEGSDACAYVFFADDGRSFLMKEYDYVTPAIQILEHGAEVPEINGPPPKPIPDEPDHARIVHVPASWPP